MKTQRHSAPAISWEVTHEEFANIVKIAERAVRLAKACKVNYPQQEAVMDLTACHANGCPLKLSELLTVDDGTFSHDVCGIRRHIDRSTGRLLNCFVPRLAAPEVE